MIIYKNEETLYRYQQKGMRWALKSCEVYGNMDNR